jgi:dihydrolipoamide dehydrogenase
VTSILAALQRLGRSRPNSDAIGLEALGVGVDSRGFVPVDTQRRTMLPHVFAIGDLTGPPLLAHRATHQGKVAAEAAAGLTVSFDAVAIPSGAYTDPEAAWVGLTEEEARRKGIALRKGVSPLSASGRALGVGRGEGLTKLVFAEQDGRLLGADAHHLGLTVHAHPTLSETLAFAAELVTGTITDLLPPRARGGKGKSPAGA